MGRSPLRGEGLHAALARREHDAVAVALPCPAVLVPGVGRVSAVPVGAEGYGEHVVRFDAVPVVPRGHGVEGLALDPLALALASCKKRHRAKSGGSHGCERIHQMRKGFLSACTSDSCPLW